MGGVALRNLTMFKKLCGDDFFPRVYLITTMWDNVEKRIAEAREAELIDKSDFWGAMVKGGANVERHWGTRDSAMDILVEAIRNRKTKAPTVLKVQTEMIDHNLRLDETAAGQQFEAELLKQREKYEREMKQMQQDIKELLEMNQMKAAEETERQRKEFEEKIARGYDDQVKLKATLEQLQQRQAEELAKMQEQVEKDRHEYEEKIQRLERAQSQLSYMDPASPESQALSRQIAQGQADVTEIGSRIEAQESTIQQKVKSK